MAYESANDYKWSHNGNAEPHELEARLAHTRAEIDDTLAAIEQKLTPKELLDGTIDYLRHHGPGPFVTDLAEQLKEHPLPAALSAVGAAWATKQAAHVAAALARKPLPTALTVVGLAWFMMAQSSRRHGDERVFSTDDDRWSDDEAGERLREFGHKLQAGAEHVKEQVADAVHRVREATASSVASAGETTEKLRERAASSAEYATHAVGEAATSAAHRVESTASHVVESAAAAASTVKRAANEALGSTREVARTAAESSERMAHTARGYTVRGREKTMQAASELEETVRRHPLVTAMFLATVGGVVAAMLPQTHREEELVGDKAEGLKETARDQLERGKRVVSAAVEGAFEGAKQRAAEVVEDEGEHRGDSGGRSGSGM